MRFDLETGVEVLERTPGVLRAWLSGMPSELTHRNEGPDTFSPFYVVGHLIHGELTDWMPRARLILEHGERKPFKPFDRFAMYEANKGQTLEYLLERFGELRARNLVELAGLELGSKQLELTGTHPRLGRVTLGQLLCAWVVHDLDHIYQISRVMAHQFGDAVGPWSFMRVLGGSES